MSLSVDVRAHIGEFHLDVRFTLRPGLTVVFGPSGAGKTRMLRLIAGLDRPDDGHIHLDGTVFDDTSIRRRMPPHERNIGMVFQQPYLLPHRTVIANVALALRDGDRAQRRARATELLEQVDATTFTARRPSQLSGGQRQRVALARALAGDPRLLLLDEPFNALELPVRRQLRRLVRDLVEQTHVPTLFVTHDLDELTDLADHVLYADHGTIATMTDPASARAQLDREPPNP